MSYQNRRSTYVYFILIFVIIRSCLSLVLHYKQCQRFGSSLSLYYPVRQYFYTGLLSFLVYAEDLVVRAESAIEAAENKVENDDFVSKSII